MPAVYFVSAAGVRRGSRLSRGNAPSGDQGLAAPAGPALSAGHRLFPGFQPVGGLPECGDLRRLLHAAHTAAPRQVPPECVVGILSGRRPLLLRPESGEYAAADGRLLVPLPSASAALPRKPGLGDVHYLLRAVCQRAAVSVSVLDQSAGDAGQPADQSVCRFRLCSPVHLLWRVRSGAAARHLQAAPRLQPV